MHESTERFSNFCPKIFFSCSMCMSSSFEFPRLIYAACLGPLKNLEFLSVFWVAQGKRLQRFLIEFCRSAVASWKSIFAANCASSRLFEEDNEVIQKISGVRNQQIPPFASFNLQKMEVKIVLRQNPRFFVCSTSALIVKRIFRTSTQHWVKNQPTEVMNQPTEVMNQPTEVMKYNTILNDALFVKGKSLKPYHTFLHQPWFPHQNGSHARWRLHLWREKAFKKNTGGKKG